MNKFTTYDKVLESNRIEGILRLPSRAELMEFERFMALSSVTVPDLVRFVDFYQPGAVLRDRVGLNVRVGSHVAPRGGPGIESELRRLLDEANLFPDGAREEFAYQAHHAYETLHPFTDGNGRSGRMLWYWMMGSHAFATLGFLHAWYYQSLQEGRRAE